MKCTSAEIKRMARESLRGHWGMMIGAYVLMILLIYAVEMPFAVVLELNNSLGIAIAFSLVSVLIGLVSLILQSGVLWMHMNLARGQEINLGMMFSQFKNRAYRFILASLLVGLIAILCFVPGYVLLVWGILFDEAAMAGVSGLLLIAGTVVYLLLLLRFTLIMYLFMDYPDMGVITAFRESAELMKGNKGRVFYIGLSFIGWVCLGTLSCGIGLLWIMPYMAQTMVQFYLDVKGETQQSQSYENRHSEGMAVAAMVLGIVGLVMSFCVYPGFICGALGIILGILSRGGEMTYPGCGKAGIILGSIAAVISFIAIFVWIGMAGYMTVFGKYYYYY